MKLKRPSLVSWSDERPRVGYYWVRIKELGEPLPVDKPPFMRNCQPVLSISPKLPVHIYWGETPDEDDPTKCTYGYLCLLNGKPADVSIAWPWCSNHPISKDQYEEMLNEDASQERR